MEEEEEEEEEEERVDAAPGCTDSQTSALVVTFTLELQQGGKK